MCERVCERKRASLSHMSKGRTVIPGSFVVSGVEVPGVRLEPTCFPPFLLSFYFSLLLHADPIVIWETYTDSYGVFLDVHMLIKKSS